MQNPTHCNLSQFPGCLRGGVLVPRDSRSLPNPVVFPAADVIGKTLHDRIGRILQIVNASSVLDLTGIDARGDCFEGHVCCR